MKTLNLETVYLKAGTAYSANFFQNVTSTQRFKVRRGLWLVVCDQTTSLSHRGECGSQTELITVVGDPKTVIWNSSDDCMTPNVDCRMMYIGHSGYELDNTDYSSNPIVRPALKAGLGYA